MHEFEITAGSHKGKKFLGTFLPNGDINVYGESSEYGYPDSRDFVIFKGSYVHKNSRLSKSYSIISKITSPVMQPGTGKTIQGLRSMFESMCYKISSQEPVSKKTEEKKHYTFLIYEIIRDGIVYTLAAKDNGTNYVIIYGKYFKVPGLERSHDFILSKTSSLYSEMILKETSTIFTSESESDALDSVMRSYNETKRAEKLKNDVAKTNAHRHYQGNLNPKVKTPTICSSVGKTQFIEPLTYKEANLLNQCIGRMKRDQCQNFDEFFNRRATPEEFQYITNPINKKNMKVIITGRPSLLHAMFSDIKKFGYEWRTGVAHEPCIIVKGMNLEIVERYSVPSSAFLLADAFHLPDQYEEALEYLKKYAEENKTISVSICNGKFNAVVDDKGMSVEGHYFNIDWLENARQTSLHSKACVMIGCGAKYETGVNRWMLSQDDIINVINAVNSFKKKAAR